MNAFARIRALTAVSGMVVSFAAAGVAAVPAAADPAPTLADASHAADAATAAAIAAAYGHAVVIDDKTSETSQLSAEADGTEELLASNELAVTADHGLPNGPTNAGRPVPGGVCAYEPTGGASTGEAGGFGGGGGGGDINDLKL